MKDAAYAKINLSLDITGRRADGYHTLRTVMQSISLCDTVTLLEGDAGKIEVICSGGAPCGKGNTVYRAAEEFFRRTGKKGSASFRIEKRIPAQAGLGGGSADAAAALRLLNRRFQTGLSAENLREIGLSAGADVPFCVEGGTALAEGIGEKLTVLSPLPECWIAVCKPPEGISTREAYAAFDAPGRAETGSGSTGRLLAALKTGSLPDAAAGLGNMFEAGNAPGSVRAIKARMASAGALGACMTGSGSAVFGLFGGETAARQCADGLRGLFPQSFLCRPIRSYG
jgi:4-diphosphocytidyl-2-C-methyl-D-erythritol kinase